MALNIGTETVTVSTEERTWRVNIETARISDPVVTVFRETVMTASDGTLISKTAAPSVQRSLSVVADQSITVPGASIVLTLAQVAATIAAVADQWRQEDIVAASQPRGAGIGVK